MLWQKAKKQSKTNGATSKEEKPTWGIIGASKYDFSGLKHNYIHIYKFIVTGGGKPQKGIVTLEVASP